MMKSLSLLFLAFHDVSSFAKTSSLRNSRVHSGTVPKAVTIDLSSLRNITSWKKGLCDEAMLERGVREIRQLNAIKSKPEKKTNDDDEVSSEILEDLRSKSIMDLKLVCSKRSIRYKGLEEHEELIKAIVNDIKDLKEFSVSGHLVPGVFNEISGDILEQEMNSKSKLPLLLDVYATFCGPCKYCIAYFQ